jgi:hypothetical protein
MKLSFPSMLSRLNGLPHLPGHVAELPETPKPQPHTDESPGFLRAGFAPFEPDLTQELSRALGTRAARHMGDRP